MRPGISRQQIIIALLVVLGAAGWWRLTPRSHQVVFAVPTGMTARLATGEDVQVLPQTITLKQNDTLIIRNDDTQPVQIGPFRIEPGQRFTQQYYNRGTYDLICSLHRGERLRIVVD